MILMADARHIPLRGESVDSIVTDPPYELGFMGKKWDSSGVAYSVDVWREALRVLKPGGHLLAFGGSRTYHRMACAIEDAGFEMRDQIMWIYGSGFPKSLDVSKAIDKAAGEERKVVGPYRFAARVPNSSGEYHESHTVMTGATRHPTTETAPSTDAARQWSGWGTALKPAHEPIVVARKPLIGTVADNVQAHGTGALNIDGCRVGVGGDKDGGSHPRPCTPLMGGGIKQRAEKDNTIGRWPANVIHDGSEEVVRLFPSVKSGGAFCKTDCGDSIFGKRQVNTVMNTGDSGSAARFFYCAKASKEDREWALDGFKEKSVSYMNTHGGNADKGETWSPIDERTGEKRNRFEAKQKNHHPTVKPLDLMRYLCRLVTPPGGIVLDPFAGSGSTLRGAFLEGFKPIGIELNAEYCRIARGRMNLLTPAMAGLMG